MNEPSVFEMLGLAMPDSNLHYPGNLMHRDIHNAYGLEMQKATYEAL
jgi:alpha-glucosidase (family GH31 glycosyl hydrolase)